ncbi:MAG: hypothetical protein KC680_01280 [Candidatus Peregrinibacteria bacterium]|nr:hypothetical protein [Candidatus Peregrinibacteria bacterium]MCB9808231.1 hypothetical protein [Candidatus Peribacteria bacterium]
MAIPLLSSKEYAHAMQLHPRQYEAFTYVAWGLNNAQISDIMAIQLKTTVNKLRDVLSIFHGSRMGISLNTLIYAPEVFADKKAPSPIRDALSNQRKVQVSVREHDYLIGVGNGLTYAEIQKQYGHTATNIWQDAESTKSKFRTVTRQQTVIASLLSAVITLEEIEFTTKFNQPEPLDLTANPLPFAQIQDQQQVDSLQGAPAPGTC